MLPTVKDCIKYIESLGYKFKHRRITYVSQTYIFECVDKSRRPEHNHVMEWSLREMRDAVRNGC